MPDSRPAEAAKPTSSRPRRSGNGAAERLMEHEFDAMISRLDVGIAEQKRRLDALLDRMANRPAR